MRVVSVADGRLELVERPDPEPAVDQIVAEVAGAGINRADLAQRAGRYPAPPGWPPDVPGLEFAGTVVARGPGAESIELGARVLGILGGGGHATRVLTRASLCAPVPDGVDLVDGGGIAEVFVTAHDAMLVQAALRPGERVLVQGVGSGVGIAAIQLARALGATTVGTSRTASKLERARELGLDQAVVASPDMAERIGEVDVVIDLVGGDYVEVDAQVCAPGGRIVVVGLLAGGSAKLDLGRLMRRRLSIRGTVLRSRPDHDKAVAVARFAREVLPLLAAGTIRPITHARVPLDAAADAYDLVASNATFGKVVLTAGG